MVHVEMELLILKSNVNPQILALVMPTVNLHVETDSLIPVLESNAILLLLMAAARLTVLLDAETETLILVLESSAILLMVIVVVMTVPLHCVEMGFLTKEKIVMM